MAKFPFMKFFPGDFLSDTQLSVCSPCTRGIWIDILCAMHLNERCGEIEGTVDELARICRCSNDEMKAAIDELKKTGTANVTVCNDIVTFKNRRMYREHKARVSTRVRVRRHRERNSNCNASETAHILYSTFQKLENGERRINSNANKDTLPFPPSELEKFQENYPQVDVKKSLERFIQHRKDKKLPPDFQAFKIWVEKDLENGWNVRTKSGDVKLKVGCVNGCTKKEMTDDEKRKGCFCPECGEQLLEEWELRQELTARKRLA